MIETYELLRGDETVEQFTRNALSSFRFFGERVLGLDIQPHHMALWQNFHTRKRSVNQVFRGSGKTTILGVGSSLWLACRDRIDRRGRPGQKPMLFMVTSATQRQSYEIIRAINNLVRDYEFLGWLKGEGVWTKRQLEFSNGAEVYSEVWNDNMRGRHVTHILCDEASLYANKNLFYSVVEPMAFTYGANMALTGTPMSEYDLMAELVENRSGQYYVERIPVLTEGGESAWPARFPLSELKLIQERIGYGNFAREYLLQVLNTAERLFPQNEIARCLSRDIDYEFQRRTEGEGGAYFIGMDLASSPTGDYTAVAILRKDGGRFVLASLNRYRGMDFASHVALASELAARYMPLSFLTDSLPFGKQLVEEVRRQGGVDLRTFEFTQKNRMEALLNLGRMFSTNNLIIPRGEGQSMQMTDALIHELSGIVPEKTPTGTLTYKSVTKHDDLVMSLSIAAMATTRVMFVEGGAAKVVRGEKSHDLNYVRKVTGNEVKNYSLAKVIKGPKPNYLEAELGRHSY